MASKKKTAPHDAEGAKPLKVGSRVRCTDDGVEGRLVWANATAVKIRWDDGEWRQGSRAPIVRQAVFHGPYERS